MTMTSGSRRHSRILVIGSSNTDLVCQTDRLPQPGETVASSAFAIHPGGKAANQAVAAARAGASVSFVGCFGDDGYGEARWNDLIAENIDLSQSRKIDNVPSGLALIAVDPGGENSIITVGGANDHVSEVQVRDALASDTYDVVLLPNEAPEAVVRCTVHEAGDATVVLNAAPFSPYLRDIANQIDVLICNEIEASQFLDRAVDATAAERAAEELSSLIGGTAIITLGRAGAVGCQHGDRAIAIPALPVDVVDTTGAGDAFCGAFAAWIARGEDVDAAIRAGVAAGSLSTTVAGAQPSLPGFEEIALNAS